MKSCTRCGRLALTWLAVALVSFPVTVLAVVLSDYRWNPYLVQMVFLGLCNLVIVWRFARREQRRWVRRVDER